MTAYEGALRDLEGKPLRWVVTGAAGFIGSHLVEKLLSHGQFVAGVDNFSTGKVANLEHVRKTVGPGAWRRFQFLETDIRDQAACVRALESANHVLHQAGLGSVPRSIERPMDNHEVNVNGFLNILLAARAHGIKRVVYASSSAVYGDNPGLPKVEEAIGRPLSPYAASKRINEVYAESFHECYGLESAGLRYFNVFGPRQDPAGAYAAVVPLWIASLRSGEPVYINGDGETSRDFCYVANIVQANILAAVNAASDFGCQVFNVALGGRTTLNELFGAIRDSLARREPSLAAAAPVYRAFRAGDIRHSQADITRIKKVLGYEATHQIAAGLDEALDWYWSHLHATPSGTTQNTSKITASL